MLQANPGARLALVGDGPARAALEEHFEGLPVKFMVIGRTALFNPAVQVVFLRVHESSIFVGPRL